VSHPTTAPLPAPLRILIVDDDPTTRVLLQDILGREGHDVAVTTSGEQALAQFAACPPHLVLLDVMMPGIDGFETCERMRRLDPLEDVPIVMLTGADDFAAIDRAFQVRATDFLTKPFKWKLLLQRVRYALRAGELHREVRQSRARQAAARRIARLTFWEWHLEDDSITWSDHLLPLEGAPTEAPPDVTRLALLVHPDDVDRLGRAMAHTRETGNSLELELRLRLDAGERLVRVLGEPGALGRDRRIVSGALQDLTAPRAPRARDLALHDDPTGPSRWRALPAGLDAV